MIYVYWLGYLFRPRQAALQCIEPLHLEVYSGYVRCLLHYAQTLVPYSHHAQAVATMQRAQAQAVALCFALLEAHVAERSLGLPPYQAGQTFCAAFRSVAAPANLQLPRASYPSAAAASSTTASYTVLSLTGKALWALLAAGGTLADVRTEADKILRWIAAGMGTSAPVFSPPASSGGAARAAEVNAHWRLALDCLYGAHSTAPEPAAAADAALEAHDAVIEFLAAHATCRASERPQRGRSAVCRTPPPLPKQDAAVPADEVVIGTPLAGSKRDRHSSPLVRPTALHGSPPAAQASPPRSVPGGSPVPALSGTPTTTGGVRLLQSPSTPLRVSRCHEGSSFVSVTPLPMDLPAALTGMALETPRTPRRAAREGTAEAAVGTATTVRHESPISTARSTAQGAPSSDKTARSTSDAATSALDDSLMSTAAASPHPVTVDPHQTRISSTSNSAALRGALAHHDFLRMLDRNVTTLGDALRCLGVEVLDDGSFYDVAASPRRPPSPAVFSLGPAFETCAGYGKRQRIARGGMAAASLEVSPDVVPVTEDCGASAPLADLQHAASPLSMRANEFVDTARVDQSLGSPLESVTCSTPALLCSAERSLSSPPPQPPLTPCLSSAGSTRSSSVLGRAGSRVRWSECVIDAQDSKRRARLASFDELSFGPRGEAVPGCSARDLERAAYRTGDAASDPTPLLPAGPLPVGSGMSRVPGAWPLAMPSLRCVPALPPRHSPLSTGFAQRMWQLAGLQQQTGAATTSTGDVDDSLASPLLASVQQGPAVKPPAGTIGGAVPRLVLSRSSSFDWAAQSTPAASPGGRGSGFRALRDAVDSILSTFYEDEVLRDAQVMSLQRAYTAALTEREAFESVLLTPRSR